MLYINEPNLQYNNHREISKRATGITKYGKAIYHFW